MSAHAMSMQPPSHAAASAGNPYNLKPGEHSTGTTIMGE